MIVSLEAADASIEANSEAISSSASSFLTGVRSSSSSESSESKKSDLSATDLSPAEG
jgi:hypothetical protein